MKQQEEEEEGTVSRRFDRNNIKVLPETEAANLNLPAEVEDDMEEKKTKKKTTLCRVRELIRWASASRSDKAAVLKFISPKIQELRKRSTTLGRRQVEDERKRVSFRWERERGSTLSAIASVPSPKLAVSVGSTPQYHLGYGRGNWITSDSEFVVLEL